MSDAAVDTSAEISAKDLKEKKEVVEETENGRDAPANGNAVRKRMVMKMMKLREPQANGQLRMMRMTTLIPRSRKPMKMTRQQIYFFFFFLNKEENKPTKKGQRILFTPGTPFPPVTALFTLPDTHTALPPPSAVVILTK